eukprot:s6127_g9.t1
MALLVLELLAAFAVPLATGEEGYCAAGQDCPADKPRKAKVKSCSVPDGREVAPRRMLALQAAAKECKHLSGCRAVTAFVGTDFQKDQEYEFRFVTGVRPCTPDPEYRTVLLPADSKGSHRGQWGGPVPLEVLTAQGATLVRENPPIAKFDGFLSEICLALGRR